MKQGVVTALGALLLLGLGACGGGSEPETARVTAQPASVSVGPGGTARFEVRAQGTPPLQYQWRRNGLDIPGATEAAYVAPPAADSDSADEYDVVVSNEAGSEVSEPAMQFVGDATVVAAGPVPVEAEPVEPEDRAHALATTTPVAPTIAAQPVGVLANPRQTATFTVVARGTAPLRYQWRRNNVPIAGATRASYTTPPLALSSNGSLYSVVVRNAERSVASSRVRLTVTNSLIAPAFAVQPASVTVAAGKPATFRVRTTGSTPAYQWFRNGRRIAGATGAVYTLARPALADSGALFTVQASNRAGTLLSRPATLTVGSAKVAPRIAVHPVAVWVKQGTAASFDVVATGTPPFSYQWRRNGATIVDATAARYSVVASAAQDNAAFSVLVRNGAGSVASRAAVLSVASASEAAALPRLVRQPAAASVAAGGSATFTVAAVGVAPLRYQWLRNGVVILAATNPGYTTGRLAASDNGALFSVNVTNARGTVRSRSARLTVTLPAVAPVITAQPRAQRVTVGQVATFSVAATGTAPVSYQWLRNGAAIAGATAASYRTAATTAADNQSRIRVRVSNSAGSVLSAEVLLTVDPRVARLPAGTTDRYLAGRQYVVDPNNPAGAARFSPTQANGSVERDILGGRVDAAAGGVLRAYGIRQRLYTVGAKDLFRLDLDRAAVMPTSALPVAAALPNACDQGYRHLGSSASGEHVIYVLRELPLCFAADFASGYFAVDVGPGGSGARIPLSGLPMDLTLDANGEIDGYLVWTSETTLAYQDAATASTTAVPANGNALQHNGGAFTTPSGRRDSIRTRGGIVFRDGNRVVRRFDKASKTLSAPLWRQLNAIDAPSSRVAVYGDALLVADVELLPGNSGPGSAVSGEPTLWRVEDRQAAAVTTLAKGAGLNLTSIRYTRDYVLLTDQRAEHVAISRRDGKVRWSGPNQTNESALIGVTTSLLGNTVFFSGKPIGGTPRLVALQLDTLARPPVLSLRVAGTALSDVVPLGSWFASQSHGMPLSHVLAWRTAAGRTDLSGATLVWVDMATAEVVASSGVLPVAAYDIADIGLVSGHAGIASAGPSTNNPSVPTTYFTFGITPASLRTFTPPS